MFNEALECDSYEIIGGEKFMAPSASPYHNNVMGRLYNVICTYLYHKKSGYAFTDSLDVHLPDGNLFRPDLTVVKSENASIINWQKAINGVPDMVVEVLSNSTRKKDLTIKKDIYEKNGVKEYWIIDQRGKTVDVFILRNGKYELDESYFSCTAEEFDSLDEEDKAAYKPEIKVSIFDDLFVKVDDIFSWGYDS